MDMTQNVAECLNWLSRVRFFRTPPPGPPVMGREKPSARAVPTRLFLPLMILWYTLAIIYAIMLRWVPMASWHGPVQLVCDLLLVTGIIYLTGTQDSYFICLYPLAIS